MKPTTVEEYLAAARPEALPVLTELRRLARLHAPDAEECLKWGAPAYVSGTILFQYAGYARHANMVFTPSTKEAFDADLAAWETGKGSIKLPYGEEVPSELIGRMMDHRVAEYEERGVTWM